MPKRKARKGMFSTDDARRKTAPAELERYERLRTTRVAAYYEGGCVLRGKGWLFQEVRMPKNLETHRGMRHED